MELIDLVNCYNFSISNNLTQVFNFPIWIPDCDSRSPVLLDSFLSSDASICSPMVFPPVENSDHVVVSVSTDVLEISNRLPCFSAWLMTILVLIQMVFVIIWEMFHRRTVLDSPHFNLQDVPWEDIFGLSASAAASEFCAWFMVGIKELHSNSWNLTFVNKLQFSLILRSFIFKASKNW